MSLSTVLSRTARFSAAPLVASVSRIRFLSNQTQSTLNKEPHHWSESLATPSEADVKADKNKQSPHELQEETVKHQHEDLENEINKNSEPSFDKDDVKGPLAGKGRRS